MNNPFSKHILQSAALNISLPNPISTSTAPLNSVAPLKLSLSQLTTLRWSLTDEVLQLKQTGYDAIGLWRPKVAEFGEKRTAEILQRARLAVSSLSFAGGFTGGCGFGFLDAITDGRQAIGQAQVLGAPNVIMVGGSQNGHTVRHSRRMVVDGMRELGECATASRIKLSLLPMHRLFNKKWTFLNSLDQALDILDEIGQPSVGLAFDAYHLWREPRLLERIPEIARLTQIVQLSDCEGHEPTENDRLMPGEGIIPLSSLVQAFQMAGFAGYFDVQVWSSNVWQSNYAHRIEQGHAAVKSMSLRAAVSS